MATKSSEDLVVGFIRAQEEAEQLKENSRFLTEAEVNQSLRKIERLERKADTLLREYFCLKCKSKKDVSLS